MASKHICPKCGGKEFITVAHVTQDWVVDEFGNFIETANDYGETVAGPDDGNIWECTNCHAEGVIAHNKKRPIRSRH